MTKHQKRLSVPKSWPVERKTETFTVKADAGPHGEAGVPLVVLLRDVLEYADSRREARYATSEDNVLVNGGHVGDVDRPIGMFDIISFPGREEHYRVFPDEGGRLSLTPIDEDAAGSRLGRIVGKQQVSGGDTQLTLHDGSTLIVEDDAYAPRDSLVVDNEDNSIVAHFTYEEGALVTAVQGQHAGRIGEVEEIVVTPGSGSNSVAVDALEGDAFETIEEYVVVIDENFVEGGLDADESETDDASEDEGEAADEADAADDEADADEEESATEADDAEDGGDDE